MLRRSLLLFGLCLAVIAGVFMCGCESEGVRVSRALEPYLESYVAQAEDKESSPELPKPDYGDDQTAGILSAYGVDVDEFHKLCFARFSYSIGMCA